MTITKSKTHEETIDAEALELLKLYLDKESSKLEKQKWDEFCCSGRWTKVFIGKQGSSFLAKRTIGAACAKVFSQVSPENEPPIVTAAKVHNVRESAKKLHSHIREPLPYPPQSMTAGFNNGLRSLIKWRHSDCITLTSQRGKIWRRWCAHELAREMLWGFHEAPDKLIAELLSLLWGPVDDAWVRKILCVATRENLRLEIKQHLAYQTADHISSVIAEGIINSVKQVCTEEAKEQAEKLLEQAKRLLSGKPRFEDDTEAELAAMEALGCISDEFRAQAIIAEIRRLDTDC
ncbi:MAG: hypothetical protein ACXW03_08895 [Methylobacter sp.]